jgi:hypothetical protein
MNEKIRSIILFVLLALLIGFMVWSQHQDTQNLQTRRVDPAAIQYYA